MTTTDLLDRIYRAVAQASEVSMSDAVSAPLACAISDLLEIRSRIQNIDAALRVPAAEYVPAIGDVFNIIDGKALAPQ